MTNRVTYPITSTRVPLTIDSEGTITVTISQADIKYLLDEGKDIIALEHKRRQEGKRIDLPALGAVVVPYEELNRLENRVANLEAADPTA